MSGTPEPLATRGDAAGGERPPFSALNALQRAAWLTDPGSLALLTDADSAALAACGRIDGRPVLLGLTDGRVRGGTIGVRESRQLSLLGQRAERGGIAGIVLVWDTGGVRVQEGSPALAAASAVGVALCRHALLGVPVVSVVTPPRGCFGAPSVVARTSRRLLLVEGARWGLTGPALLETPSGPADPAQAGAAVSAQWRHASGQADAVVADDPAAVRNAVGAALAEGGAPADFRQAMIGAGRRVESLEGPPPALAHGRRHRDLFRYSFRGNWRRTGPQIRNGVVEAAWGEIRGEAALGIVVGPDPGGRGLSIADAKGITAAIASAAEREGRRLPAIVTFVFCRGHENRLEEERGGLPVALAECLRAYVAARLRGHPLVCVLGGGAYGAAYLALAAPSHRVLAIRGTTVAPMAPRVLAAFQKMRGLRDNDATPRNLAALLPQVEIVESVVRLPRAVLEALAAGRREGPWRSSRLARGR